MDRIFLVLGGLMAALVVILGAFGAHTLKGQLTPTQTAVFQTAVQYHMFHALGMLVVGVLSLHRPHATLLTWAGWLMLLGTVLFCGSLYVSAITGYRGLALLAPVGGSALILAWALFAISAYRQTQR